MRLGIWISTPFLGKGLCNIGSTGPVTDGFFSFFFRCRYWIASSVSRMKWIENVDGFSSKISKSQSFLPHYFTSHWFICDGHYASLLKFKHLLHTQKTKRIHVKNNKKNCKHMKEETLQIEKEALKTGWWILIENTTTPGNQLSKLCRVDIDVQPIDMNALWNKIRE